MQYTSEIFILRRTEKTEKGFQSIMVEIVNSLNFPLSELSIDNSHYSRPFKKKYVIINAVYFWDYCKKNRKENKTEKGIQSIRLELQ